MSGDDGIDQADEGQMKYVLIHAGDNMEPYEVKVPKPPYEWVDPSPKTEKGGPTFNKVDKPGGWISLSYLPVFESRSQGGQ